MQQLIEKRKIDVVNPLLLISIQTNFSDILNGVINTESIRYFLAQRNRSRIGSWLSSLNS